MRQHYNRLLRFTAFFLVVLLIPACATQVKDYTGATVSPPHALSADPGYGQWETNDLKITYTVPDNGSVFLEGDINFDSYLGYSFPLVERFRLTIYYLDKDRTVLASEDISPLIGYRRTIPTNVSLPDVPPGPPGTRYFAFSYWGFFSGNNNSEENTGDWEIYFKPFDKEM